MCRFARRFRSRSPLYSSFALNSIASLVLVAALTLTTGCGSSNSSLNSTPPPQFSGNTSVTLVLSSAGNDQLLDFEMYVQSLSLTNKTGATESLIAGPQPTEFMHLNGLIEPYGTVTIPQGIYTSATATIGDARFTCMTVLGSGTVSPGSLDTSMYEYGYVPDSDVTVNMANPITVTGDTMTLQLSLQTALSAAFPSSCYTTQFPAPYAITPTFNLSAISTVSQPTNSANGKVLGMVGEIQAMGTSGNQFVLYISESHSEGLNNPQDNPEFTERTVTISANSNTVYYGINNFDALQAGSFVDLDGAIQSDGSIVASRISLHDPTALNVLFGPVVQTDSTTPDFFSFPLGQQGVDYDVYPVGLGTYQYTSSTVFQISDQFTNLGSLPFVPSFSGTNMVPGQNMATFSQQISYEAGPSQWSPANVMTLLPQTIDGTILGVGENSYQVQLAPYDLFPILANQPGQTNLLTYPDEVEVYTDSNTALLNTTPLAEGSTGRFYGLIFNVNGQLEMDCAQISDGADVSPVASSGSSAHQDEVPKVSFRMSADGVQHYTYTKYEKAGAR
jgi:hypothetical protein